jgi:hypothetical protein
MEGRPPIYTTPEELQEKIDDYFKNGVESKPIVVGKGDGKTVIDITFPVRTGARG